MDNGDGDDDDAFLDETIIMLEAVPSSDSNGQICFDRALFI